MKITIIPARSLLPKSPYKNAAAYCRVSTKQDIQHLSLEAQRDYYQKKIESNPLWNFVGIYADHASGRNNLKMKSFQQMMHDCRAGKIDIILVKSISRLGRNTVQFLKVCMELNALQVDVYFEVENVYISDPQAVKLLTIYASLYQNESESKSSAIKWSFQTLFANGNHNMERVCQDVEAYLRMVTIIRKSFLRPSRDRLDFFRQYDILIVYYSDT